MIHSFWSSQCSLNTVDKLIDANHANQPSLLYSRVSKSFSPCVPESSQSYYIQSVPLLSCDKDEGFYHNHPCHPREFSSTPALFSFASLASSCSDLLLPVVQKKNKCKVDHYLLFEFSERLIKIQLFKSNFRI